MVPKQVGNKTEIVKLNYDVEDWKTKMDDLSEMTFTELDEYIDTNVTDFVSAKVYLIKISKALLALMKLFEEKIK